MAETSVSEGASSSQSNKPIIREGFSSCIRCGATGIKGTFYGRGKQFCSTNCVKGTTPIIQPNNIVYHPKLATVNTASSSSSTTTFKQPAQYHLDNNNHSTNNNQSSNNQTSTSLQKVNQSLSKLHFQTSSNHHQSKSSSIKEESDNANNGLLHTNGNKEMKNKIKTNGKLHSVSSYESQQQATSNSSRCKTLNNSFDWCTLLRQDPNFKAAPVSSFKHVPCSNLWNQLVSGNLKVEYRNKDAQPPSDVKNSNDVYWIATVVRVEGYYLLLRWEGYENDSSADFWVNIYNSIMHPVGWSATQRKHLMPPKAIVGRQNDWKTYLTKSLIGANTLPQNFVEQIKECLKSNFRVGMRLEVVDKTRISSVRPATINKIIGGRLHVIYDGLEDKDNGFWCHQQSNLIHPVGWAQLVGHELRATSEYATSSLAKARNNKWSDNDADFTYFPHLASQMITDTDGKTKFEKGMKLEAVDPLNLSTICCATVTKVLRYNYIMVGIDGMMARDGSDWFCYHATSSNIFPVGTCNINKLPLTPPKDYQKVFNWFNYLKENSSIAAPVSLFNNEHPIHGFQKGMYLEAVDLMEPRLICVAVVKEVVGRLLKIHFNGWNDSYDQWVDCESVELFPVGWCEIVGYPLEPPREDADPSSAGLVTSNFVFDSTIKKRSKQPYKGGRSKKRKRNNLSTSDKLNGSIGSKDDESMDVDDHDTSTQLFNSTIDQNDDDTKEESHHKATNNDHNDLTRNSTVTFKPSPLINSNNQSELPIVEWSVQDVVNYFKNNGNWVNYSESFMKFGIDGEKLIRLTKEDILQVTDNKLGPSLKLFAYVEELKKKAAC